VIPHFLEGCACDGGEQVDAIRGTTELDHLVRLEEILGRKARGSEAKLGDHCVKPGGVLGGCADQNVDVTGIAWKAVKSQGKPSHDHVFNALGV
jgi:hypothetical protein